MGMLDDDLAMIHADALALGMATACTYAGTAITATFQETPQPFINDEGSEVRRREASISVAVADVATPAKGDAVVVASGVYAGTWKVIEISTPDDGCLMLTCRFDDRIKAGQGRRLP
jgi:hypothetical protein